jgi:hypothetical protein
MAVSVVQTATIGGDNWSGNFGSDVTAGNTIFLAVTGYQSADSGTITSSGPEFNGATPAGSSLILEELYPWDGAVSDYAAVWMMPGVAGGASSVSVTVSNSANIGPVGIIAFEVAGLGASPAVDSAVTVTAEANSTSPSSGASGDNTQQPEIVLGVMVQDQAVSTLPSGWTCSALGGNSNSIAGYQIADSTGNSYTFAATASPAARWAAGVTAVYAGSAPAAPGLLTALFP